VRILYLHQYFRTPAEGGALRSYYLATAMAAAGHGVTLITAHDQPQKQVKVIDGVTVHYLPVPYANHFTFWQRSWSFIRFVLQSSLLALKLKKPDLVYASSTPLTIGIPALLLRFLKDVPYVFEVRDLWPEAPIQLGAIRNPALIWLLRKLEKLLYRNSRFVVALSPGMADGVKAVVPEKQVLMVPNMADCSFYKPFPKPEYFKGRSISEKFVIAYTGALGVANRAAFLVDLAMTCHSLSPGRFLFLIAGSGAEAEKLKSRVEAENVSDVLFFGSFNRESVRELLQAADAAYTSFDEFPVLETNSPNKFFDSLAAGRICLVNTKGWLKELVEENQCGLYLPPNDPVLSARLLVQLSENAEQVRQLQSNARLLAENRFSKAMLTEKILKPYNYILLISVWSYQINQSSTYNYILFPAI
jgi:glycosyltransferase involved in cell wall biosynthesis